MRGRNNCHEVSLRNFMWFCDILRWRLELLTGKGHGEAAAVLTLRSFVL